MPLPPWDGGITSLSLREIANEFGGPDPLSMSNYYAGGPNVPVGTVGDFGPIPSAGTINIQQFYGSSNVIPLVEVAHFDETTIVGDILSWTNKVPGGPEYDLEVPAGDVGRLRLLPSGVGHISGNPVTSYFEANAATGFLTTNFDIRWFGRLRDLPSGADSYTLVSRDGEAPGERGIAIFVQPNGTVFLAASLDGNLFNIIAFSTVAIPINPNASIGIRVTRTEVNGNIIFWTSTDFISWSGLGSTVAGPSGALFNNGLPLLVGAQYDTDVLNVFFGEVQQLEASVTLGSEILINMDTRDATGSQSSWVDPITGVTWTPNGDAFVNVSPNPVLMGSGNVILASTDLGAPTVPQPYTMFLALKPTAAGPFNIFTDGRAGGNILQLFVNANLPQANAGLTIVGPAISNSPIVMGVVVNGASSKLSITGVTDTLGDMGLDPWLFGVIFGNLGITVTFNGWIGELKIFNGAMLDTQFNEEKAFLEAKWVQ